MAARAGRLEIALLVLSLAGTAFAGNPVNPHGRPLYTGGGRIEHYALWQDGKVWHLRTMTKESEFRFSGVMTVGGGEFTNVKPYRHEHRGPRGDLFIEDRTHHAIRFEFSTQGSIDGVDFRVKGKDPVLSFTLMAGEKETKFEPGRIFIGRSGLHPASSPFEYTGDGR